MHRAWRLRYRHIRHSLERGFYQGWDLHPAQLPVRYAAVYAFFLEGLDAGVASACRTSSTRRRRRRWSATCSTTRRPGQGLLNYFLRGIDCGAHHRGGGAGDRALTLEELRSRSFVKILEGRQKTA